MRLVIDGKSLLIGAFCGAALLAGFGAMQKGEPQAGRFKIEAAATSNAPYAYVIDTVTGRVWETNAKNFHGLKLNEAE